MQQATQEYRGIVADSLRWAGFVHRPGDVFVCTPPKCGTTWTQTIVTELIFPNASAPGPVVDIAPWLDARFNPIDDILARLDAQTHRRQMKTHTPADGIPMFDDASYIVVGRDGRDACMSFLNHMRNMQPESVGHLVTTAMEEGLPFGTGPPPVADVHEFFTWWLDSRAQFEHIGTWWEHSGEPNVLFVHFDDLLADLDGEMRRIAAFLGIAVDETALAAAVARCTFAGMKARPNEIGEFETHFVGGADTFLYKGTNGRWQGELTQDELDRYQAAVAENLTPECARWLAGRGVA